MHKLHFAALILSLLSMNQLTSKEEVAKFCEGKKIDFTSNVGNKKCPVTGFDVDGVHTVKHNGKEYNLCGNGACEVPFTNDPDRYARRVEMQMGGN